MPIKKPQMKKWRVWFEQVNQDYLDVVACTKAAAILDAKYEWRLMNRNPKVIDIKELKGAN